MIYTFLIASRRRKVADLARIRTISVFGHSEAEARAALRGLPLIFVARRQGGAV